MTRTPATLLGLMLALLAAMAAAPGVPAQEQQSQQGPESPEKHLREIVVRVLPQSSVSGETFTLGEVAELDGFDVPAIAELAKTPLGRSPLPGRAFFLSEGFLRSRLAGGPHAGDVRIEVPKGAQVVRAGQTVTAGEIERMVLAQVLKDAQAPAQDVKLELLSSLQDVSLPAGAVEWEVTPMGKHLAPSGDRSYQVAARLEGKELWRTLVRVRQKVYQTVVQAARPIRRDQVIGPEDVVEVRKIMPAGRDAGFLGSAKLAAGMIANRPIAQDEPLHAAMVRAPMAVNEGGRVILVFESGLLRMEAPGVALAGGQVGQFIPVRNLQSDRVVHGVVQKDETVRVN